MTLKNFLASAAIILACGSANAINFGGAIQKFGSVVGDTSCTELKCGNPRVDETTVNKCFRQGGAKIKQNKNCSTAFFKQQCRGTPTNFGDACQEIAAAMKFNYSAQPVNQGQGGGYNQYQQPMNQGRYQQQPMNQGRYQQQPQYQQQHSAPVYGAQQQARQTPPAYHEEVAPYQDANGQQDEMNYGNTGGDQGYQDQAHEDQGYDLGHNQ